MSKKKAIIIGGSGQLGISLLHKLLNKNFQVLVTTRDKKIAKKKISFQHKNLEIIKLDIRNRKKIKFLLCEEKPQIIFYFAGQSSPSRSFAMKKITFQSNVEGCENFLKVIYEESIKCKFVNASSCEIFDNNIKKISVNSKKKPISPYGNSKLRSHNLTKFYREKKKLETYNAIFFNTESVYRNKNFLIPKICIAAINANKYKKITYFGNLDISREWNWSDEQTDFLIKFINKKPQDFILSNGKSFSARQMIKFAFDYYKLDYKKYIGTHKKFIREKDFLIKRSNYQLCLKRNKLKRKPKIYGKKIINLIIKNYEKRGNNL